MLSFAAIIAIQFLVFALFAAARRIDVVLAAKLLVVSAVLGVPIGFLFDVLVGHGAGIFRYHIGQAWWFIAVNGFFSYGLALATAALIPELVTSFSNRRLRFIALVGTFSGSAILLAVALFFPNIAFRAFVIGGAILLAGEAGLALQHRQGPVAAAVTGALKPALSLWVFAISIGLIYESANYFFPVWRWSIANVPQLITEAVIVLLGYFVLFHLLHLLGRLLFKKLESK